MQFRYFAALVAVLAAAWTCAIWLQHSYGSPHVKISVPVGHGSGTYIGNGRILTALHVVAGASVITVRTEDRQVATARMILADPDSDMAVLQLDSAILSDTARISCAWAKRGDTVRSYGNPLKFEFVEHIGHIAGSEHVSFQTVKRAMLLNISILPGMSGGAVLNESGRIIGINTARLPGTQVGYSAPTAAFCPVLRAAGII